MVDGAKFRVQALNDGNTYDQIVTVTNGSLLLENILSGDYKVTEVQTPNSVSGTGYLLDPNNEYTVTVEPGATKTLNVVNYEPSGQITLTKRDSETGTAQGSATLQGAVYQLSASTNIVRAMVKSYIRQDRLSETLPRMQTDRLYGMAYIRVVRMLSKKYSRVMDITLILPPIL